MSTCFNCRSSLPAGASSCPVCGARIVAGTWQSLLRSISPRAEGWGISSSRLQGTAFRAAALLVPVWLPPLTAIILGAQAPQSPLAIALLLAPFAFIPGLYVLANRAAWSRTSRFLACIAYLVASAVAGYGVLASLLPLLSGAQ